MKEHNPLPEELLYSSTHEWIRILKENIAVIGVTDYAFEDIKKIGYKTILFIELPDVGKRVDQTDSITIVETEKTVADILSPISGQIIKTNDKLKEEPMLIASDPYGQGWIVKIRLTDLTQLDRLMSMKEYGNHVDILRTR
ncbi:MAG: glycine cleavage system protein GcvH [Candidatus Bathyarchaeia archaeon]